MIFILLWIALACTAMCVILCIFGMKLLRKLDSVLATKFDVRTPQVTQEEERQQVRAIHEHFDRQAAANSAARDEHIEVHNSDNLGEDLIIEE